MKKELAWDSCESIIIKSLQGKVSEFVKVEHTWNDSLKKGSGVFYCGKCGFHADIALMDSDEFYEPKICPECGRKVDNEKR